MTTTTSGFELQLSADQHPWDEYPHTVWDYVPVTGIRLYDILDQTLQVQGFAAAEHRGKPAIRLDIENVVTGGKGRLVLTADQIVCGVKRYNDGAGGAENGEPTAREALLTRANATPAKTEAPTTDFGAIANAWAKAEGVLHAYETEEQQLFAFLCAGVSAYSSLPDLATDGIPLEQQNAWTLQSIAENVAAVPAGDPTD